MAKSYLAERVAAESSGAKAQTPASGITDRTPTGITPGAGEGLNGNSSSGQGQNGQQQGPGGNYGTMTLSSVFPGFSLSKYSKAMRLKRAQREGGGRRGSVTLPPGVEEPTEWIKNSGPLQIEPKVWLANERTFLRWQHICVLLGGLAISLYTAAGRDTVAEWIAIGFILTAAFAGGWGYFLLHSRRQMIIARSGKDFDNFFGPLVVSVALMVALILNFSFAVSFATSGHLSVEGYCE